MISYQLEDEFAVDIDKITFQGLAANPKTTLSSKVKHIIDRVKTVDMYARQDP